MFVCRIVDSYLSYLNDLVAQIMTRKPEVLRSGEQERLDFILQFSTMEELISALVERRIEKLAYTSTHDLMRFFDDKLGLSLIDNPSHVEIIEELIEARNVIVHNHGMISKTFKRRLPTHPGEVGEHVRVLDLVGKSRILALSVGHLDQQAVAKFGLTALVSAQDFPIIIPTLLTQLSQEPTIQQPQAEG